MQGDLESRLRDAYRDGLGDAWDLCQEAADTLAAVWDRIEGAAWLTKYQREFFLEALDGTHDE